MTTSNFIKVGTRGSLLARTQTNWLINQLKTKCPDLEVEVTTIKTTGDINVDGALPQSLGKGLFTREIEDALLENKIDLAVHSLKDLPTEFPDGLAMGAITEREDASDVLIGKLPDANSGFDNMTVGTSSLRRAAQIKAKHPTCRVMGLRGNIDTRIRKVEEGRVDCAIVAASGLNRLDLSHKIAMTFEHDFILPAAGQGALAVETRADDQRISDILQNIRCDDAELCVNAERAFLHHLGGGCRVPVAAFAEISNGTVLLKGRVIAIDGSKMFEGSKTSQPEQAMETARELADSLLSEGASNILDEITDEDFEGEFV